MRIKVWIFVVTCIHVRRSIYDVGPPILLFIHIFPFSQVCLLYSCKKGYLWCRPRHSFVKPSVYSYFHSAKYAYFTCDDVPRALIQQEKIPTADLKNLNHIVFFYLFFCGMISQIDIRAFHWNREKLSMKFQCTLKVMIMPFFLA